MTPDTINQMIVAGCCAGGLWAHTRSLPVALFAFPLAWLYPNYTVWVIAALFLVLSLRSMKSRQATEDNVIDVEWERVDE